MLHSGELTATTKLPMLSIRDVAWACFVIASAGVWACAAVAKIPPPKVAEAATATAEATVRIAESLMLFSKKLQNRLLCASANSYLNFKK